MHADMCENQNQVNLNRKICQQAGYLPVPLQSVPPESLAKLRLYINNGKEYSLYRRTGVKFGIKDYNRLIKTGVKFVYVSVRDHKAYYQTIENSLKTIISDPKTKLEKKSEILYSTSIELANQILEKPPAKEHVDRTTHIIQATVKLIMQDEQSFSQLYAISDHDFYTATHMVNVCSLALAFARKIGLSDKKILHNLGTGAMLHDIGKVFVSSEVLNTEEKLTDEQFAFIKSHVERGYDHLTTVTELSYETLAFITEHHERMDGSGYPRGLKKEQISIMGRIAGIVDTFEAMTSVRPYRSKTFSVEEVLQYLEEQSRDKYDHDLVVKFVNMIKSTLKIEDQKDLDKKNSENVPLSWLQASLPSGKRHYHRFYFRIQGILRRINRINKNIIMGPEEKIIIHNLSCSGIGFLSGLPLKADDKICLIVPDMDSKTPHRFVATIVRSYDHLDGWHSIGAQFHNVLSAKLIHNIQNQNYIRKVSSITW